MTWVSAGALGIGFLLRVDAEIQLVSVADPALRPAALANGNSAVTSLSSNGTRVAFVSDAANLVTNDANSCVDVFVRDRLAMRTLLASANATGTSSGNGPSTAPVLSADGQKVAFESDASDLVTNDFNGRRDVFLRDLSLGLTRLVSVNRDGTGSGNGVSSSPAVSAAGDWIAFESLASDLVTNDTNNLSDIFVRDVQRGKTLLVSLNASGTGAGNGASSNPSVTPDGRYVIFLSRSSDLVSNGRNDGSEVFVRDLEAGVTYWASSNAPQFLPGSAKIVAYNAVLSANGRFAAFKLATTNAILVVRHELQRGATQLISSNYVGNLGLITNLVVFSDFSGPQISDDGESVAYTSRGETNYSAANQVYVWESATGTNRCVSVNLGGTGPGNQFSGNPVLTADGRTVVFESTATDLATNVVTGRRQAYACNLLTGQTRLLSCNYNGAPSEAGDFGLPIVSGDGRWVALESADHQIVPNDYSPGQNVYLWNLETNMAELMSAGDPSLASITPNAPSSSAPNGISMDNRFIVFTSMAGNLGPKGGGVASQVYRRDVFQGVSELVSMNTAGSGSGNDNSSTPVINADGGWVAFESYASDLAPLDTNNLRDIFVRDMHSGGNILASQNVARSSGLNLWLDSPWLSADGQALMFRGHARYFVAGPQAVEPRWYLGALAVDRVNLVTIFPTAIGWDADDMVGFCAPSRLGVFAVGFPSAVLRTLDLGSRKVSTVASNAASAAVSSGGSWLAYVNRRLNPIAIVALDLARGTNFVFAAPPGVTNLSQSADGQIVAYQANDPSPAGGPEQIYVYDNTRGTNRLVTVNLAGNASGNGDSANPLVSPDGRYVVFKSWADNLVANDTNGFVDLFVRDLLTEKTFCLSTNWLSGNPANSYSGNPSLGRDGRTVSFDSFASDLVPGDYNACRDVFLVRLPFSDLDGDGMDDAWEIAYFGDLSRDGTGDYDNDGMSDRDEYVAGTDPTDNRSLLRLNPQPVWTEGGLELSWSTVPGKAYRLQYASRLGDPWMDLPGDVQALSATASKVDETIGAASQRFYRVVLVP